MPLTIATVVGTILLVVVAGGIGGWFALVAAGVLRSPWSGSRLERFQLVAFALVPWSYAIAALTTSGAGSLCFTLATVWLLVSMVVRHRAGEAFVLSAHLGAAGGRTRRDPDDPLADD